MALSLSDGVHGLEETLKRKAGRQQVCLSNLFLMYRDLLYALEASIPTRLQSKMPYTHKKRLLQLQHISRASLCLPDSGVCRLPGVQWMPWGGVVISRPFVYDLLSKFPLWIFFVIFGFWSFWDLILVCICSPCYPRTHSNPPALGSWVL